MSNTVLENETSADLEHLERLLARGIQVIRVIHPDLFGRQRGKQFPVSALPSLLDGIAYSKISLAEDLFGVPVDEKDFPAMAGHPDLHAKIEPGTAIIPPWEPDAVWVLSSLWENGERSQLCARGQLQKSIDALQARHNLSGVAAAEPEFYLFHPAAQGETPKPYSQEGVSYTIDRITDPEGVLARIHRKLIEFGIGVTALNREFSPGQFEINLHHTDSLNAADQVFLLKSAIKELAIDEGYRANFMAKPLNGEEGSSLHVHLSLWNGDANAMDDNGALSPILLNAIGGIQEHADAILAFASPTVNSYKRLHGFGLSPDTANWGEDDRFTFLRIPAERGKATRLELRAGDASASPHLLIAAMNYAIQDGIERNLAPAAEGKPLPKTLRESIDALRSNSVLREAFGDEFIEAYVAIKLREVQKYEVTVTDFEWDLYHSHA